MKRFFTRIFRFFWSWGFLKFALFAITLIILLYAEEDWRGARAWAATKAKWEARGLSFDPNTYYAPSVPDEKNLAALPLFNPAVDSNSSQTPVALARALHEHPNDTPPFAPGLSYDWMKGQRPNFDKLHQDIAAYYAKIFSAPSTVKSDLAQWTAIYPFITQLNTAAETRPYFRLKEGDTSQPAVERSIAPITAPMKVVKVLSVHAGLAINEGQPELAVADVKIMLEMSEGIGHEPSLVGGLVSGALGTMAARTISEGLNVHVWNDAQLAKIQSALERNDVLVIGQHSLRGECAVYSLPMYALLKKKKNLPSFWAEGWIDQALSQIANHLFSVADLIDPVSHRVNVDAVKELNIEAARAYESWTRFAPSNFLVAAAAGPIINAERQFARIQTWMDEGRIACGLERYRLAHGKYPDSLDALVAAGCIDHLPCDPINGEPYRYHINPDGTFALYSIGWNQKDDGGEAVFATPPGADEGDSPLNYGDWVWPTPKR